MDLLEWQNHVLAAISLSKSRVSRKCTTAIEKEVSAVDKDLHEIRVLLMEHGWDSTGSPQDWLRRYIKRLKEERDTARSNESRMRFPDTTGQ